jgi:hypothetical protein
MPRTCVGEVGGHDVHRVGEVFPRAGHARHLRLSAELAFGANFTRHARHFGREGVELVHHGVDGVLEFEDLALHVDRNLAREVAAGDGGGHFGDVADLGREVAGHRVHAVGQIFPGAGDDAGDDGLSAEPAFGADLARHACHFGGERAKLLDHRVQRFLEREDLAADVHRDLLRQVALGDGGRDLSDVAHLGREVRSHEVDVVGEVLPRSGDAGHLSLSAKLAFGADFARDAGHFAGEGVELVDHRVDGRLQFENFATDIDRDLAREVASGDGRRYVGDVADLRREVGGQQVDVVSQVLPGACNARHVGLSAEAAFGADLARDARHLTRKAVELIDHRVQRFLELQDLAAHVHGDLA